MIDRNLHCLDFGGQQEWPCVFLSHVDLEIHSYNSKCNHFQSDIRYVVLRLLNDRVAPAKTYNAMPFMFVISLIVLYDSLSKAYLLFITSAHYYHFTMVICAVAISTRSQCFWKMAIWLNNYNLAF